MHCNISIHVPKIPSIIITLKLIFAKFFKNVKKISKSFRSSEMDLEEQEIELLNNITENGNYLEDSNDDIRNRVHCILRKKNILKKN